MSRNYKGKVVDLTIPSGEEMFQSVLGKVEPIQGGKHDFVPCTGFGQVVMNSRNPDLGRVKWEVEQPNVRIVS